MNEVCEGQGMNPWGGRWRQRVVSLTPESSKGRGGRESCTMKGVNNEMCEVGKGMKCTGCRERGLDVHRWRVTVEVEIGLLTTWVGSLPVQEDGKG